MSTQTRVTKGVREGGQFKATAHAESTITLAGPAEQSPEEEIESLVELRVADVGPGIEPSVRTALEGIKTDGGKLLWARYQLGPDAHRHRYHAALKYEEADAVHALGFETSEDVERAAVVGAMPRDLMRLNVGRDRVDALAEAFPDPQGWSVRPLDDFHHTWYREAVAAGPIEDVIDIHARDGHRAEDWRDMVGLADPARADRAQQFLDSGCFRVDWVTSDHSPEDLLSMARMGGKGKPSDRNTDRALHRLNEGLAPEDLRDFGARFVDRFGVDAVRDLRQNRIDSKAVKAVHHALAFDDRPDTEQIAWSCGQSPVQTYARLVSAGVTTSETASQLHYAAENVDVAVVIQRSLGAGRAAEYRQHLSDTGEWRRFDKDRVRALAAFDQNGGTPEQLVAAGRRTERESLKHIEYQARGRSAVTDLADAMASGVTADRVEQMSRAGIPPLAFKDHQDADDLWTAGAPYREAYAAEEARLAKSPFRPANHREKRWPWTEADYAD
ncbi:hypothetical protein LG293_17050 (plasmid) [Citricoccus nitrophenolicus]